MILVGFLGTVEKFTDTLKQLPEWEKVTVLANGIQVGVDVAY